MTDHPLPPVPRSRWVLAVTIVALAAFALWLLPTTPRVPGGPSAVGESNPILAVAPGGTIDLATLPHDHQALYRAAAADLDAFQAVACYCGCEAFLEHRHLLDCFARPSGGWERHATGCAICMAQARDVIDMREDGVPLDEIIRTIDGRYGGITKTTAA